MVGRCERRQGAWVTSRALLLTTHMRQRWSGCAHRRRLKVLRHGSSCSALEIGGDGRYRTVHLTPTQLLLDAQGTQREERLGTLAAVPGERPLTVGQLYVAHTQAGLGASHMRCVASLDSMSCWRISSSCERRVSQCFSWASVKRASVAIIASQRVVLAKALAESALMASTNWLVCYHPSVHVTAQELPRPKAAQITEGTNGIVPEIPNVLGRPPPSKHQLSSEDARGIDRAQRRS